MLRGRYLRRQPRRAMLPRGRFRISKGEGIDGVFRAGYAPAQPWEEKSPGPTRVQNRPEHLDIGACKKLRKASQIHSLAVSGEISGLEVRVLPGSPLIPKGLLPISTATDFPQCVDFCVESDSKLTRLAERGVYMPGPGPLPARFPRDSEFCRQGRN